MTELKIKIIMVLIYAVLLYLMAFVSHRGYKEKDNFFRCKQVTMECSFNNAVTFIDSVCKVGEHNDRNRKDI